MAAVLAVLPALGGCGLIGDILGAEHGYLFKGFDVLCHPGQEIELAVRLQYGEFLGDRPGRTVRYSVAGQQFGQAVTDRDGYARLRCIAPARPGDYRVVATLSDRREANAAGPARLLLAVRDPDQRILVTDVDQTLEIDGFRKVLTRHSRPMPDAVRVLHRLQREAGYTIVYLTLRPTILAVRTRDWLVEFDFPEGPVFHSDTRELMKDRTAHKPRVLAALTAAFPNIEVGISDKPDDCRVYRQAGLPLAVLLFHPAARTEGRLEEAYRLAEQGESVQTVTDWRQVEQVLFDKHDFPLSEMIDRLRRPPDSQPD